jgi:UDP-N-acetylglucosamine pyrophosphorylase
MNKTSYQGIRLAVLVKGGGRFSRIGVVKSKGILTIIEAKIKNQSARMIDLSDLSGPLNILKANQSNLSIFLNFSSSFFIKI